MNRSNSVDANEAVGICGRSAPDFMEESAMLYSGDSRTRKWPILRCRSTRRKMQDLQSKLRKGEVNVEIALDGIQYSGDDLTGTDFADLYPRRQLAHGVFVGCNLRNTNLMRFNLCYTKFTGSNLVRANLKEAKVEYAEFFKANCSFVQSEFGSFHSSNLTEIDLSGADLRGVDFTGCDLSGAKLLAVQCEGANFSNAILRNCDFRGSDLRNTVFSKSQLFDTDFSYANMYNCRFHPVNFEGSNFFGTEWNGWEPKDWPRESPVGGEGACLKVISRIKVLRDNPVQLEAAIARGELGLNSIPST